MLKKTLFIIFGVIILIACIIVVYFLYASKQEVNTKYANSNLECSSSFSTLLSINETCNFTASILIRNCKNKEYDIISDYSNCSGITNSDEEVVLCNWQIPKGNHTFSLYIGNELKDSKVISCQEPQNNSTCSKSKQQANIEPQQQENISLPESV